MFRGIITITYNITYIEITHYTHAHTPSHVHAHAHEHTNAQQAHLLHQDLDEACMGRTRSDAGALDGVSSWVWDAGIIYIYIYIYI